MARKTGKKSPEYAKIGHQGTKKRPKTDAVDIINCKPVNKSKTHRFFPTNVINMFAREYLGGALPRPSFSCSSRSRNLVNLVNYSASRSGAEGRCHCRPPPVPHPLSHAPKQTAVTPSSATSCYVSGDSITPFWNGYAQPTDFQQLAPSSSSQILTTVLPPFYHRPPPWKYAYSIPFLIPPYLIVNRIVFKGDNWRRCWKELINMDPPNKEKGNHHILHRKSIHYTDIHPNLHHMHSIALISGSRRKDCFSSS